MSRIGKMPITVPAGVNVKIDNGIIAIKGPKGELKQPYDSNCITIENKSNVLTVTRSSDEKSVRAKHGLYRVLVNNMVEGVVKGFEKSLIINGVGFKAAKQGNKLVLNIGYSHQVEFNPPAGITVDVVAPTEIAVKGIDKAAVGQAAATIRSFREPEPYHGYGIRYKDEVIQRKEGKTAGK